MLTPMRRHDLEILNPKEMEISANPELQKVYNEWSASREKFIRELNQPGSAAQAEKWEKDYFKGLGQDGKVVPQHQTRLNLKEFEQVDVKK
jgi:hypothetical protein